ncbi:MAG: aminoglycoside 6-adenylyltransferase, partial [Chloroflexi bacterium]|nr:aminoglycoside 6-adenylyltransferase [Chloroflexota bacterium]
MRSDNRQLVIERFCSTCEANPHVAAAFIGGSFATDTANAYSDLDLYLIPSDEGYAAFFAERKSFMRCLGESIFLEDFSGFGFDMVLFIFKDGTKGEIALAWASNCLHIHSGPYRVLVDKQKLLEGVTFPLRQVPVAEQRKNLIEHLKFFWRGFLVTSQALGRGDLLSAATYLEGIRHRLVSVCRLSVDFQDEGDHPRLEAMLPPYLQEALCDTFPPVEREAIVKAAKRIANLFQEVARPLAAQQEIAYPDALEQAVRAWFDK